MASYDLNEAGLEKARKLIASGDVDLDTPWSKAAPPAEVENRYIDRHGYDGYGEWHLALDRDASDETKNRYGFPFGDFHRVNRAAVIHAKQRASQNGHSKVVEAADDLLERLDSGAAKGE